MTKGTASESTGGMANTAVLIRRHMVGRLTDRRSTMAAVAASISNVRVGMIDERTNESAGVMATTAIRICCYVGGHCGRLSGRVNSIVIIVAIGARL